MAVKVYMHREHMVQVHLGDRTQGQEINGKGPNYTVIPGVRERVLYSKLYRVFDQCMKQNVLY